MRKTSKGGGLDGSTSMAASTGPFPHRMGYVSAEKALLALRFSRKLDEKDYSSSLPILRLLGAFSASEGIRKDTGLVSWVRWPSEVVLDGRVVARTRARNLTSVGGTTLLFCVNTHSHRRHGGRRGETSLYDALGVEVDETLLVEKITESLESMLLGWRHGMVEQITARISAALEDFGGPVRVTRGGRSFVGRVVGVDSSARLLVSRSEPSGVVGVKAGPSTSISRAV